MFPMLFALVKNFDPIADKTHVFRNVIKTKGTRRVGEIMQQSILAQVRIKKKKNNCNK